MELWREQVHTIDWELLIAGSRAFTWNAMEELVSGAEKLGWTAKASRGKDAVQFAAQALKHNWVRSLTPRRSNRSTNRAKS